MHVNRKLAQRFRSAGPGLVPSAKEREWQKANPSSQFGRFLAWRHKEIAKVSSLQLLSAADETYWKLLQVHLHKADALGNNDGMLTEEEYPGLQELVVVLNEGLPSAHRIARLKFCATRRRWTAIGIRFRKMCKAKLRKLSTLLPKVTIPLRLNETDIRRASLRPYIQEVRLSAQRSLQDCQRSLGEGIKATQATRQMALEKLKPAYDEIHNAQVALADIARH